MFAKTPHGSIRMSQQCRQGRAGGAGPALSAAHTRAGGVGQGTGEASLRQPPKAQAALQHRL